MPDALRRRLPNAITLARLVIAAAFFATISLAVHPRGESDPIGQRQLFGNIALLLFILAAATDALDGYLARRWKVVSTFGRIMDPFCDKVLILGTFAYLASPRFARIEDGVLESMDSGVWSWMVVIILARELLVTSIRGVVEARGVEFGADRWGKWKMIVQSIAVPVSLFVAVNPTLLASSGWTTLRDVFIYATVAITAWSAVPYILRAKVILAEPDPKDEFS